MPFQPLSVRTSSAERLGPATRQKGGPKFRLRSPGQKGCPDSRLLRTDWKRLANLVDGLSIRLEEKEVWSLLKHAQLSPQLFIGVVKREIRALFRQAQRNAHLSLAVVQPERRSRRQNSQQPTSRLAVRIVKSEVSPSATHSQRSSDPAVRVFEKKLRRLNHVALLARAH